MTMASGTQIEAPGTAALVITMMRPIMLTALLANRGLAAAMARTMKKKKNLERAPEAMMRTRTRTKTKMRRKTMKMRTCNRLAPPAPWLLLCRS